MGKTSGGILLYRFDESQRLQVLLGYMGGPFWAKRDERAWSVIKGEIEAGEEDALAAAKRELQEETGLRPEGEFFELGVFKQPSGKRSRAWALEADWNPEELFRNK